MLSLSLLGCSDLIEKMNDLKNAIEGVCVLDEPTPPAPTVPPCNYCQVNWTSVTKSLIGESDLTHAGTLSYTIPSVIPSNAREVLVHARVHSGWSNRGPHQDIKFFTQVGTSKFEKYLYLASWDQFATNTNSDNMWFPMPPNRRVYLNVPAAHGANAGSRIYAIGYR